MHHLIIPNQALLYKKIAVFKKAKANGFHVVADFDRTLTKGFMNGRQTQSSYAYIREGKYLSADYTKKSYQLFDEYHPIETDPNISLLIKIKKMEEWWEKHYTLQIQAGISKSVFEDIVAKNKIEFREGTFTFLDLLAKNNIPILIFSAGQGDLIKEALSENKKLTKNVHIISNFFIFDRQGKAVDYSRPLIHTFNKNESQVKNHIYQNEIKERKNVILLGDSIGDVDMAKGMLHKEIIKIGFLNENSQLYLAEFKKHFDIIILHDGNMDEVIKLIKEIIH